MKTVLFFALTASIGILLAGCAHRCPPPEESTECYPVCREVKKAYAENAKTVMEQWRDFLTLPPEFPFRPTRDPNLDIPRWELSRLALQIRREIIIPYIVLDRQGLIRGYCEFNSDVEFMQKRMKCSREEAEQQVLRDWQKLPGGAIKINRLRRALPVLINARRDVQIAKAVPKLTRLTLSLLRTLCSAAYLKSYERWAGRPLRRTRSRRSSEAIRGYLELVANGIRIADAAIPDIQNALRLWRAASFLWIYQADKRSQYEAINAFVAKMKQMSRDAEKDAVQ